MSQRVDLSVMVKPPFPTRRIVATVRHRLARTPVPLIVVHGPDGELFAFVDAIRYCRWGLRTARALLLSFLVSLAPSVRRKDGTVILMEDVPGLVQCFSEAGKISPLRYRMEIYG